MARCESITATLTAVAGSAVVTAAVHEQEVTAGLYLELVVEQAVPDLLANLPGGAALGQAAGEPPAVVDAIGEAAKFCAHHRDSLEAIASALRPGGRLVTVTHQWAIEKRHSLPGWKALAQADLAAVGLGAPTWSEDR